MYPLGWCVGKRHCGVCPGQWESTIVVGVIDFCICECHKEK